MTLESNRFIYETLITLNRRNQTFEHWTTGMNEGMDGIRGAGDERDPPVATVHRQTLPPGPPASRPSPGKDQESPRILLCSRTHWPAFLLLW